MQAETDVTLPRHLITLEAILALRGVSKIKFAEKAGMHRSDVTSILNGNRALGPVIFEKIMNALDDADAARFAEVYFGDMLPSDYPGRVHIVREAKKHKAIEEPQDVDWALKTLGQAMRSNEHLAKVIVNLAKCHQ